MVHLCVHATEGRGAFSRAGSRDTWGQGQLWVTAVCAGKGACLSLSCGKPGLFVFSPILSPGDPPWCCPSPDARSPPACSPLGQGDPLCKCLLVCSVRCCSVLLSPGTAALRPFLRLRAPQLSGLACAEGSLRRAVPGTASEAREAVPC